MPLSRVSVFPHCPVSFTRVAVPYSARHLSTGSHSRDRYNIYIYIYIYSYLYMYVYIYIYYIIMVPYFPKHFLDACGNGKRILIGPGSNDQGPDK